MWIVNPRVIKVTFKTQNCHSHCSYVSHYLGTGWSWCLPVRQVGVSRCWQRQWVSVSKAQWWWSSSYLMWDRNSLRFYSAASQNNLQPHTVYFLRPQHGSSSVWMSCRPLASTDWFHSQSDKQRQLWIQCRHPWWRSGSLKQQLQCSATAGGIQLQYSSGYPRGHSTGPRFKTRC